MVGTKQKVEIAFLLVAFLDSRKRYKDDEINEFIVRSVKRAILGRQGYSVDHLRRAMIDNGFLKRKADGSRYWVNSTFRGPDEQEEDKTGALDLLCRLTPNEKVSCPYCKRTFSATVLLPHYLKKHSLRKYWQGRLNKYFD